MERLALAFAAAPASARDRGLLLWRAARTDEVNTVAKCSAVQRGVSRASFVQVIA